ncbi:MAG: hypothetical protein R3B13_10515 [Polyangiaceae bacterium]
MRIRYAEPGDDDDRARQQLTLAVAHCARQAGVHAAALARGELPKELLHACREVDARLELTMLQGAMKEWRPVISCGGHQELATVARALVEAWAGQGVELTAHRPAMPVSSALTQVHRLTGLDLADARVRVGFGRGHLLDIVVEAPCFGAADDERDLDVAELLVELALGERVLDHWVRAVHSAPGGRGGPLRVLQGPSSSSATLPLNELPAAVSAAIEGLVAGLPEQPWSRLRDGAGWTMFEAEPELASEYGAQDDIAVATTVAPEMLKCFLEKAPFSSLRFSRVGEVFAYLKVESSGDSVARLERRQLLEDALTGLLGPGVGAVIGNGLGIRYVYVDLALENVERALPLLRQACTAVPTADRTWLLFCDSDAVGEWVGMHPTTPRPPR